VSAGCVASVVDAWSALTSRVAETDGCAGAFELAVS